ncbi:MAG: DUF2188 domain-containing protein [Mycoplasma sp.]|nr:DUF2188 domain-containing protein [Mycoplasma sp.]
MSFWRKLFNKRKDKNDTKEIKRPENSYDIYNQNETLTLQTEIEKDLIAYEDEEAKNNLKTFPIELEKEVEKEMGNEIKDKEDIHTENKENNNTYFVYAKNDKNGNNIGWQVKKENASKASKTYKTKEQTIEFVKNKATNEDFTCIIQNDDGSIDETIVFKAKNNK